MEEIKMCSRCHRVLPVTEFYKNRTKKDGLSSFCKECAKETQLTYLKKKRNARLVQNLLEKSAANEQKEQEQEKKEFKTSTALKQASIKQLIEEITSRGNDVVVNPTPRDLISRLCAKGFRGNLEYTEIKTINVTNFNRENVNG